MKSFIVYRIVNQNLLFSFLETFLFKILSYPDPPRVHFISRQRPFLLLLYNLIRRWKATTVIISLTSFNFLFINFITFIHV